MADPVDMRISQLSTTVSINDTDVFPVTQGTVTDKVEASTLKSYVVDDLEVSDLYDTTITTPTDNDGLVYDSTTQKWENKPVVTGDLWVKNGAHNLFNLTATTQVVSGATFTMNSNGSITISGKHTYANAQNIVLGYVRNVKAGDSFIFNGIENAFTSTSIDLKFYNSNDESLGQTTYWSGDLSITAPVNTSYIKVTIYFNNQDFGAGVTIYPMLRLATDTDATYAPYAKTNRELTEFTQGLDNLLRSPNTNDAMASSVASTRTAVFSGNGSAYTGTLPNANYRYGIFISIPRNVTGRVLLAFAPGQGLAMNYYNGSSWEGWHSINIDS